MSSKTDPNNHKKEAAFLDSLFFVDVYFTDLPG